MTNKLTIICVDDELIVLQSLREELEYTFGNEYAFEIAESGDEGLEIIQELISKGTEIAVIISDQLMPGMKGDQFLIQAHQLSPNSRKILLTGQASADAVGRALNHAKLYRYIPKPWEANDLVVTVEEAIKSFVLTKTLEKKVKILSDLNESAKLLTQEIDPFTLIRLTLRLSIENTNSKRGFLWFPEPNQSLQLTAFNYQSSIAFDTDISSYPIDLLQHVAQQAETLILSNAFQTGEWTNHPIITTQKIRSIFCSPLQKQGKTIAVLYLEEAKQLNFFDQEKIDFLLPFVSQAAIALDNALLYEHLEKLVESRTASLKQKSMLLEELYRDLKDSMYYARRLQIAITPDFSEFQTNFFPDSFLIHQPKDIVSGDFYWYGKVVNNNQENHFFALVDCTGHGVPGAFMSLIAN
ncbi:MAG: response regulator, partial [Bacteroidia bacterium]|nr:response regulator [Bacteroidia bacterium]